MVTDLADRYLAHFENNLGELSRGWRKPDAEHFQVLGVTRPPSGRITYTTFELTRVGGRVARQELLISAADRDEWPGLLNAIGEELHACHALARGRNPVTAGDET
ncbi:hypothetical protein [Actinokineospora enzanensis]|uniref:hypothetical protein n=1 Tax=Actinokineospora enzanensis TaxID=155975 RepID=UPI000372FBF0|nr:hypothetical protein [Actinokineospora enzanensis]